AVKPSTAPSFTSVPSGDPDGNYTVSWSSVTGATEYHIQESSNGGSSWATYNRGTSRNYSPSPAKVTGTYLYRVRACNSAGCSVYSSQASVNVAIAPGLPGTISVSPNPASNTAIINFSWGSASGSVSAYDFEYKKSTTSTWTNGYDGSGRST